ncbi:MULTISPECIES: helix-turn-helix transcriptional regulator [unclassified Streptomyces]|uniref:helix-turn-helix domain-containing protein n=1 Tax=unclassified Streptomyces TaxID=2593676 RepID=UPI0033F8002E
MATAESEDFAALLRELKDRSGRSYGVLAGKLHVSTSTLHRYCNGDAVPNEYAPVDRLARLCGATREESVELHRRWILADEARRKARGAAAAEAARPPAPVPATTPEPESKTEPEVEVPVKPAGAGPALVPAPAPVSGAGGSEAAESEVRSSESPLVRTVTGASTAPLRKRLTKRTRLALIGAAAVTALAVPAVAVANLSGGSGDDDKDTKSAAVADARETKRRTTPSVTPPTSGSPSPKASSPSPSGRATRSGSPTPSAPAVRKPVPAAQAPVGVGISSYQWDGPCGKFYLMDQKPNAVPKPPDPYESRPWASVLGGVDGGHLTLQLTATGKTRESVVINAVNVKVVERDAPLDWTAYSMGSGCGGAVTPGFFDIDLDKAQPRTRPVGGTQGENHVPATDFPYKVSTTDPQVLNLDVHTDAHEVTWYLEVEWSSGDRFGKIPVYDESGRPFHSSAVKGRPAYEYRGDTNVWERLTT